MAKRSETRQPSASTSRPSEVPHSGTRPKSDPPRRATVEIDRVKGLPPPPRSAKGHTLRGLFADAGLELDVKHDDTGLPDLPSGVFQPADLHRLMLESRRRERSGWYAHVLVVPEIEVPVGPSSTTELLLGLMYDDAAIDENAVPREGCAVSIREIEEVESEHDARGLEYLHTLAHELGHVFNLVHPSDLEDHTIMCTSDTLITQVGSDYPDNIEWAFNYADRKWITEEDEENVRPGGAPFRSPDRFNVKRSLAPDLKLEITTRWKAYELGDPVHLRATLRNDSNEPVRFGSVLSASSGALEIRITGPGKKTGRRFRPLMVTCFRDAPTTLAPAQEFLATEPIFFGAYGHTFRKPGRYTIQARYRAIVNGASFVTFSKPIDIEVEPSGELLSAGASRYLIMRGGRHLPGAHEELEALRTRSDKPRAAPYASLALASEAIRSRSGDRAWAKAYLESIKLESLDRIQRAECLYMRAAVSRSDRKACLEDYEAVVRGSQGDTAEHHVKKTRAWVESYGRKP